MATWYRRGFDIDVALRVTALPVSSASPNDNQPEIITAACSSEVAIPSTSRTLRSRLKAVLRLPAKALFRTLRPFARPLAFRLRSFFAAALQGDLAHLRALIEQQRQDLAQIQGAVLGQTSHLAQTQHAILSASNQSHRAAIDIVREIQADRDFIEGDLARMRQSIETRFTTISERLDVVDLRLASTEEALARAESYALTAARRVAIATNEHEVMLRTDFGYVLCDSGDHALIAALSESGVLEPGTAKVLQRLIRPGDVFVDVGANVGLLSLVAAHALGGSGSIVAFEPFPRTAQLLERTLWLNGFGKLAEVRSMGISSSNETMVLHLGNTSGHHSLFPLPDAEHSTVNVKVGTLDESLGSSARVDVLKIDVEGAELSVIAGALRILEANPNVKIIVEFGPAHLRRVGHTASEWFACFQNLGFDYRVIDEASGDTHACPISQLEEVDSVNILFSRSFGRYSLFS